MMLRGQSFHEEIRVLLKEEERPETDFPPLEDTVTKQSSASQEVGPHQEPNWPAP